MLTMYSTTWCGYCRRLKNHFDREGIEYQEIDIERDPSGAEFVESVNGGNQTVPTVLFPDGSTQTNPTIVEVRQQLAPRTTNDHAAYIETGVTTLSALESGS